MPAKNSAPAPRRSRILDEEDDDPLLSSINLVDVFLVALGILMISQMDRENRAAESRALAGNEDGTLSAVVAPGERLPHFRASGASAAGNGVRAGTAYRLKDGSLIYVPSEETQP